MRQNGRIRAVLIALAIPAGAAVALPSEAIHRQPLGNGELRFEAGPRSVRCDEKEHGFSREYAHKGDASETIRIVADAADPVANPHVQYFYPLPGRGALIGPDLKAGLWLRSKTAGVQLLARVVFPHLRNPQRPAEAYTALIEGTRYATANNWQRLELRDPVEALRRRVQAMRLEMGAEVDPADAYIDQLVLNLYSGAGETQVWINEIEVGPMSDERAPAASMPAKPATAPPRKRAAQVEINRDQLLVDGKRFFFRGIRLTDTPLAAHKLAGFNAVFLSPEAPPALFDEVARAELFAIPALPVPGADGPPSGVRTAARTSAEDVSRDRLTRLLQNDRLLFWYLGGGRGAGDVETISRAAASIREVDPERPIGVNAWDGLWPYSRNVDLLGIHRWPLHTSLDLLKYRDWLTQRRLLARPGTFTWTWIQTHLPEWYTTLVYDKPPTATFDEPIGPEPEQIRLLTYIALASGCRGLGYWSDRFLADTHQGRDRLLEVALLNLELQLLEPVLLSTLRAPVWIETSNPNVKAAVLFGDKGILVLPIWLGGGSQYVPGQSATIGLSMTVPLVPPNFNPSEVTPAEVRTIIPRRIAGGTEITLPDFSLTTAVVFTGDVGPDGLLPFWQEQCRRSASPAAEWTIALASIELDKVRKVTEQLAQVTTEVAGTKALLRDAERRLKVAQEYYAAGRFREAYAEAKRALRPVRQLMRLQWEQAVKPLSAPVASPYAVSYFTLPRHWTMMNALKRTSAGENLLRGGDFEGQPEQGWSIAQTTLDEVTMSARFSNNRPHGGTQCLELSVVPKDESVKPAALERTFIAMNSPVVSLPAGTLVRISAWVRIPAAIKASADGALFYDNIGGEPLSIRLTEEVKEWKQFTLIRRAPASGQIYVTLALTGMGTVQFDDIKIEPLYERTGSAASEPPAPRR